VTELGVTVTLTFAGGAGGGVTEVDELFPPHPHRAIIAAILTVTAARLRLSFLND